MKYPPLWERALKKLTDGIWWVRHRTINRYDVVWLRDLEPGYYEVEDRLFHSMMQILCDFVERELAWHDWCCDQDSPKPKSRDRARGLAHLEWAIGLKCDENHGVYPDEAHYGEPTGQAESAAEVKAIYLWYRDVFQKRLDVGDESGLYATHETKGPAWETACKRHHELEEQRYAEEATYMKRLVDVRRSMWT
jgi:hypothetical protein